MNESTVPPEITAFLERAYEVFNSREIDVALAMMAPDVEWPNGMEGGYMRGREAVRDYWTRQWGMIDPRVEPQSIEAEADGRYAVTVRQTVRDLAGSVLNERTVVHVWLLRDGLVESMEIRAA